MNRNKLSGRRIFAIITYFTILLGNAACFAQNPSSEGLPLYFWQQKQFVNFGDYLSLKLVERIVNQPVEIANKPFNGVKKLLAVGSVLYFANDHDVIWGTGVNGKIMDKERFHFQNLDVRAVRGPQTRRFLKENFNIDAPQIYGDPVLLMPFFFPEFKKPSLPKNDYTIVIHYSERSLFPKEDDPHVIYSTDPWDQIINRIIDSKFVISTALHGIVVAEAYGVPARLLRVTDGEKIFKYRDYYEGTKRPNFEFATSIEEALKMGGEAPMRCDLKKLYHAFPKEFWPSATFTTPNFKKYKKAI